MPNSSFTGSFGENGRQMLTGMRVSIDLQGFAGNERDRFNDEASELPTWFVDEEKKYYRPFINLTKEEIAIEKEQIKAYNCRPSKKVEEAKNRKKKRLTKAMQKIKKKAVVIADQDINEASKMKQIQKLYKKEKAKH